MRKILIGVATVFALSAVSTANASPNNSTLSGAAIGAGTGAVVAGPIGAVAGGVVGAIIGGPTFHRTKCWRDRHNVRHCR